MKKNNEQFTQIPNSLMSNKDLTDQDKLTLGLILSWDGNNKECFMGNEYIAEKMGISKNAASIRIKRLEKLGCISLRYTYKEGKMEVDKRFITLLSLTPKVSSHRQGVSSDRQGGIVPETMGYRPADEGVSSKQGGIKQDLLDNLLDNELDKLLNKELNKENSVEGNFNTNNRLTKFQFEQLSLSLNSDKGLRQELVTAILQLTEGNITSKQKELIKTNKSKFDKMGILQPIFQQYGI